MMLHEWFAMAGGAAKRRAASAGKVVGLEALEPRQLFAATVQGYTPAQIRHAYGFDTVSFANGTIAADGSGQTIAIVDAYNHPNIAADLAVFDQQFNLPAADLTVVNQTGGKSLPSTDAGWAGEISLDVEWAHAIAPGAKLLLVEANSSSLSDLLTAVDTARHAAGVSVVSMSWGGSEFFSWIGGESSSETGFDFHFTTPSGHQGVTFFASAGDSGSASGVQWPSASPNVVSIGGTSLHVSDAAGTYSSEVGWSGTNGGYSQVEDEPSYQRIAQTSGVRTVPDVSYDADPNTGFAMYDSLAFGGTVGWQEVGGTSAGSPQWAALVAIANQGRELAGLDTLHGTSQTLPALYSMYTDAAYGSSFFDVTTGGGSSNQQRWGGFGNSGYSAAAGYDLVTGLGSPRAGSVIATLVARDNGAPAGTTAPAVQVPTPLSVAFRTSPVGTIIEGKKATVRVRLTNVSGLKFSGPVSVTLYVSTDDAVSNDDVSVATVTLPAVKLPANGSRPVALHFTYPGGLADGSYQLVASVDTPAVADHAPATGSTLAFRMEQPRVDLSTTFADVQPIGVVSDKPHAITLLIQNLGNVAAAGTISVVLYRSGDGTLDASDVSLVSRARPIHIRPGGVIRVHLRFIAPADVLGGQFNLVANVFSTLSVTDTDAANDTAVATTASL